MAEEKFSVKAILSAYDKGFTSAMKNANKSTETLGKRVKDAFSFGLFASVGQKAFSVVTNGAKELVQEIDSSNISWKTFEGNMKILKKSPKYINETKKTLQEFAEQTIYNSSDMAQTFAQLESVGTKNTVKLVKGFGGLAAAAENPKQAMKTLSQQATQMAARPKVAWQDFKLMLEQSPSGMAAVAKKMGMSAAKLTDKIQNGEIKTKDFFKAVTEVGNSADFQKIATQAKSTGQAMDGLKETLANKLTPAFELMSGKAVKVIEKITDKIGKIDGDKWAKKIAEGLKEAEPYYKSFVAVLKEGGTYVKKFGGFLSEHKDEIAAALPYVLKFAIALKGFQIVKKLIPGITGFTKGLTSLAGKGFSGIAKKLFGISTAQDKVGKSSSISGKKMLQAAESYVLLGIAVLTIAAGFGILAHSAVTLANSGGMAIGVMFGLVGALAAIGLGMTILLKTLAPMGKKLVSVSTTMLELGAAVLIVALGFAVLAQTSIALTNAGGGAIGVMFGLVAVIGLLAAGAAALGPSLNVGAMGFVAFGAAMLMVGGAAYLAAQAISVVAGVLPVIAEYGTQGALSIAKLGLAMSVFALGAAAAGVALLALSGGLLAVTLATTTLGAAVGVVALSFGAMALALMNVNSKMKSISASAKITQNSLKSMKNSVKVVESGLEALGSKAKSTMQKITNAFDSTAEKAEKAGIKVGKGFTVGMKNGLNNTPSVARSAVNSAVSAFRGGYNKSYSAGAYISKGFAAGMQSCLGQVRSAAARLAAEADKAVRAKAKIHSPSRVAMSLGNYWGEGYINGLLEMVKDARRAAEKLVNIPTAVTPKMAFAGEMSEDYEYYRNAQYTIVIPVDVDGKTIAKVTAPYTQEELNRLQSRQRRKQGKV